MDLQNSSTSVKNYFQPSSGNTENFISVIPMEMIDEPYTADAALRKYQVSNFWRGYNALKRLIRKIFKYKLNSEMNWYPEFWDDILVLPVRCELRHNPSNKLFSELKPVDISGISRELFLTLKNDRITDINNYAVKLKDQQDLGYPIYISGAALNLLGGNVQLNEMYMVDGARRITAHALCHHQYVSIWLIEMKEEVFDAVD